MSKVIIEGDIVYKTRMHEEPAKNEVLVYELDNQLLKFNMVPKTVMKVEELEGPKKHLKLPQYPSSVRWMIVQDKIKNAVDGREYLEVNKNWCEVKVTDFIKMQLIDDLSRNIDRRDRNIMVLKDMDKYGLHSLKLIDHENTYTYQYRPYHYFITIKKLFTMQKVDYAEEIKSIRNTVNNFSVDKYVDLIQKVIDRKTTVNMKRNFQETVDEWQSEKFWKGLK